MVENSTGFSPIFPHEDIELFRANISRGNPDMTYELGQFVTFLQLHMQIAGPLDVDTSKQAFVTANGETGADVFSNKYRFGNFVNQLGYTAPRSILIDPSISDDARKYYEPAIGLDEQHPQRFCKPLYSTCGRGASVTQSPEDAVAFAVSQGEPYLVQTLEFPQRDWRYILHRDVVQLQNDKEPGWRITSQKVRPSIVGDGVRSVLQLVKDHEMMPRRSKNGYIKHHPDALSTIPLEGETVELIQAANIAQGAYPQMGTDSEVRNLDRFMSRFLNDAEESLGTRFGTLCVDLGVKDSSALSEEYDFEKIKRNLVFYEHQMPFDILYDIPAETSWGAGDKFMPRSLHEIYIHRKIQWNLMRSVVRSGRHLRKTA